MLLSGVGGAQATGQQQQPAAAEAEQVAEQAPAHQRRPSLVDLHQTCVYQLCEHLDFEGLLGLAQTDQAFADFPKCHLFQSQRKDVASQRLSEMFKAGNISLPKMEKLLSEGASREVSIHADGGNQRAASLVEHISSKYAYGRVYSGTADGSGQQAEFTGKDLLNTLLKTKVQIFPLVSAVKLNLHPGVNIQTSEGAAEALCVAAQRGDNEMVKFFLREGTNANATSVRGMTALMHATAAPGPNALLTLIGAGANLQARDAEGRTALVHTIMAHRISFLRHLISAGADVNIADNEGKAPLWHASYKDRHDSVLLLLEANANPDARNTEGETALLAAVWARGRNAASTLIDQGADIDIACNSGITPLMAAVHLKMGDVVIRLLGAQANVNSVSEEGASALYLAVWENERGIARQLIAAGADVNFRDPRGCTVLMVASERSPVEDVRALIEAGAELNLRDENGHTALHYARGNKEVAQILRSAGATF